MTYVHRKHFSLRDAQILLKKIKPLVRELAELKRQLDARGFDVYRHQYFGGSGPNGDKYFPAELQRLVQILKSLDELGVLVKGLEEGLIDFPHVRANGEEVYLCFKADEEEIRFWHSLEGGFAGRRPLAEL
ncbi:MAG TPA: DUF2203 domain-containing protein [Bacteroidota bacterium]|nr:DUF2203 domain-containing protein [Bacteroidota bacterium]